MEYIVLFDTGIRRESKIIGNKIRKLFGTKDFDSLIARITAGARTSLNLEPALFALSSIDCWRKLNAFVDADVPIPDLGNLVWGHKLCGAGGGGYGIAYVKKPEDRWEVMDIFHKKGLFAEIPILLNGIDIC